MGYFKSHTAINVIYKNGVKDHISPALLATLITTKQVEQFERAGVWVTVGVDPVRKAGGSSFSGNERRCN